MAELTTGLDEDLFQLCVVLADKFDNFFLVFHIVGQFVDLPVAQVVFEGFPETDGVVLDPISEHGCVFDEFETGLINSELFGD